MSIFLICKKIKNIEKAVLSIEAVHMSKLLKDALDQIKNSIWKNIQSSVLDDIWKNYYKQK